MNPRGPEPRRIIVDCTVAVEVTVQYDPLGASDILSAEPDWTKLKVGIAYWHPAERRTVIGISTTVTAQIERELPKRLDMRWNPRGD